ncbi:putative acetylxylan esterase A [Psilocybe cubensis]|uniref:Carboxylic ester hydrolase n=2 Tax=Psilocybe cubensis TaxID=181762 RepID=A0A8H7XM21_PSICU|nr:putative acetylxylan esterase A [Psilocybe cubensis]KAH9483349.1 putative acetylxylan esterase A [Psilocybe cubensis]
MFAYKALITLALSGIASALTSSLQQVTANFGSNPTNVKMYVYKPTAVATPTPLIVAMHYCTGTAQAYFSGTSLAQLADQHGFIVVYPNAPTAGGCWDVASSATLSHNGGGDSLGIANMVRYAIANWGIDSTRVFATGTSSGAMMTNVMLGAYPDLFAAGSLYSGVPFGCFAGPNAWNTQCATGELIKTPQQWGDQVRAAYPGFTGTRPKVQFWHGTIDTTLYPQNFWEEIKQWTNVFNVSQTPTSNLTSNPQAGYSRASFGPNVQAILAQNVGHTVPEHETDTLAWFGLSSLVPGSSSGSGSSSAGAGSSPTSTAAPSPTGATSPQYGQCGGIGWTGPTGTQLILYGFDSTVNACESTSDSSQEST